MHLESVLEEERGDDLFEYTFDDVRVCLNVGKGGLEVWSGSKIIGTIRLGNLAEDCEIEWDGVKLKTGVFYDCEPFTVGGGDLRLKKKPEHTPGPWKALPMDTGWKNGWQIVRTGVKPRMAFGGQTVWDDEFIDHSTANINLISAAPDLLDALQRIEKCSMVGMVARDIAHKAIAKATGGEGSVYPDKPTT